MKKKGIPIIKKDGNSKRKNQQKNKIENPFLNYLLFFEFISKLWDTDDSNNYYPYDFMNYVVIKMDNNRINIGDD